VKCVIKGLLIDGNSVSIAREILVKSPTFAIFVPERLRVKETSLDMALFTDVRDLVCEVFDKQYIRQHLNRHRLTRSDEAP